jgi:parallel beta-helix repeat protein
LGVSGPVNAQVVSINQQAALAGNVSPGDAPGFPVTISQSGTYVLNGPLTVDGLRNAIVIEANDVELNCDGEVVRGIFVRGSPPDASMCPLPATCAGILLESRSLVTVINCPVTNFGIGFLIRNSTNNVFQMNRVENNRDDGFQLENADRNFFIQNTVRDNDEEGFDVENSEANFGLDHGVGHPLLLLCHAKAPNY